MAWRVACVVASIVAERVTYRVTCGVACRTLQSPSRTPQSCTRYRRRPDGIPLGDIMRGWGIPDRVTARNSETALGGSSTERQPDNECLVNWRAIRNCRATHRSMTLWSASSQAALSQNRTQDGELPGFMAQLWLHTVHIPHPAMPQWYHNYSDVHGQPAGDYLGTVSQMDAQIGRLRAMLRRYGVADDTLLLFTSDNGPHPTEGRDAHACVNGLRQCKGSVFEGGIRVPTIVEWPGGMPAESRHTAVPGFTADYLPTVLDFLGKTHPRPEWQADGESLRGLITAAGGGRRGEWARKRPLVWRLGEQAAYMSPDGRFKLVRSPGKGQCPWDPAPYLERNETGPFLFDLWADPTESEPANERLPEVADRMARRLEAWERSVAVSQVSEAQCARRPEQSRLELK